MAEIQDIMEGIAPFPNYEDTQMERAKSGKCPFCGSNNTHYGCVDVSEGTAAQEAVCLDCDKGWQENYTLTNIEELAR